MAAPRIPDPVMLVVIAFSRHRRALEWVQDRLAALYGPILVSSLPIPFGQTSYYEATMGPGLERIILVFDNLVPQDCLAAVKLQTNALEQELAVNGEYAESRPVNLDPGILQLGKFLLATTKDQSHRIYLRDGIFAEVTLRFEAGKFQPWPWTYSSYREPMVLAFFEEIRAIYYARLRFGKRLRERKDA